MAKRDPSKDRRGERTDIPKDADGLDSRQRNFCLFYLSCQGKKPYWAAGKAGYSGDLAKRSRSLLQQPKIQEFLERYAPPVNRFKVTSDPKSITNRLEQISSGEGVDKTTALQLKAIELMGKSNGMWEGASAEGRDRLHEVEAVFRAGPVERGSQPCGKCQKMNGPLAKFCSECGTLIEREKTPAEKLVGAKKKLGIKEVIQ
ncbi:MAG: hypothetical protein WBE55_11240 [Candidatus Sulfotelmatobacter sp.]